MALASPPAAGIATPVWLAAWVAIAAVSLLPTTGAVSVRAAPRGARGGGVGMAAALAGPAPGGPTLAWAVEGLLIVLALAWSANLYNFMDGSDGLAAMMALCGFGAYAVAAARRVLPPSSTSRWRRPSCPSSPSTLRPPARSWATWGRCRSAFSPRRSGLPAVGAGHGPPGFRCSCSCRSSPTRRRRSSGASSRASLLEGAPDALLSAAASNWAPASRARSLIYGALMAGTCRHRARRARRAPAAGGLALAAWSAAIGGAFRRH